MEMVPLYSHPKIQRHPKRKCEFLSNKSLTLLLIYDLYSTSNTNILFTTLLCLRSRKITAAKTDSTFDINKSQSIISSMLSKKDSLTLDEVDTGLEHIEQCIKHYISRNWIGN